MKTNNKKRNIPIIIVAILELLCLIYFIIFGYPTPKYFKVKASDYLEQTEYYYIFKLNTTELSLVPSSTNYPITIIGNDLIDESYTSITANTQIDMYEDDQSIEIDFDDGQSIFLSNSTNIYIIVSDQSYGYWYQDGDDEVEIDSYNKLISTNYSNLSSSLKTYIQRIGYYQLSIYNNYDETYNSGYEDGESQTASTSYTKGYQEGYNAASLENGESIGSLMAATFNSFNEILNQKVLGNITLGQIILVPLSFGLLFLILRLLKA